MFVTVLYILPLTGMCKVDMKSCHNPTTKCHKHRSVARRPAIQAQLIIHRRYPFEQSLIGSNLDDDDDHMAGAPEGAPTL